jgi:hypothetical protein
MYEYEQRVKISRLEPCPVKVTFYTDNLFRGIVDIAKTRPEQIEPIAVATLADSLYIVNGHMRVKALEEAGHDSALAYLVPVKEIADVVRMHVELNMHGSINPLKMLDAVHFLERYHAEQSISKRYLDLAKKKLYPKVRDGWDEFLADACKRNANVDLPLYVIERIAKFESEKEQLTATTVIMDSVKNLKDRKFVFPAPSDLEVIMLSIAPRYREKKITVFEPGESEKGWPKINKKEAEDLVRGSSHTGIVKCKCGNRLLLNTKTHAVSNVTDDIKNRCIKLEEGDPSEPVYAIPLPTIEFLQARSGDSLKFLKIKSKKELERFVRTIREGTPLRLVIISPK